MFNTLTYCFKYPNGKYSKVYKTYAGCVKAARKLYPLDTDRMICAIIKGQIIPLMELYK